MAMTAAVVRDACWPRRLAWGQAGQETLVVVGVVLTSFVVYDDDDEDGVHSKKWMSDDG